MKLETLLAIFIVSEARKPKTPKFHIDKLKGHIVFVWDTWFKNCDFKHRKRRDRFLSLIDRKVKKFSKQKETKFYNRKYKVLILKVIAGQPN